MTGEVPAVATAVGTRVRAHSRGRREVLLITRCS